MEDSTFGIQAAKNAGLFTIAIKDYRFGINQKGADIFVDNLTEAMNILISMNGVYNKNISRVINFLEKMNYVQNIMFLGLLCVKLF